MLRLPPRSTLTDTLLPYTTLFRSCQISRAGAGIAGALPADRRRHVAGPDHGVQRLGADLRSEEHTSELQSLMRSSYAVFCLKKKNNKQLIQAQPQCNIHPKYHMTHSSVNATLHAHNKEDKKI